MSDPLEAMPERPVEDHFADVEESAVVLPSREGTVPALLFRPRVDEARPAVVLSAEAYGINSFIRQVAATLAHHLGYVTLVPDFYRGEGPTEPDNYIDFTEVIEFMDRLDFRRATHDIIAGIEYLERQPFVRADRVAVWGYCTGGTLAMLATSLRPELAASVLFFPSQPVFETLDAAHPVNAVDLLWNAHCPILVIYGSEDIVMSPEQLAALGDRLDGWGITHTITVYPGAQHAFTVPEGPLQHDGSAKAAWAQAVSFVAQHLNR